MASTHLKNISQIGSFPQVGMKIKNIWNHHPAEYKKVPFPRKKPSEFFRCPNPSSWNLDSVPFISWNLPALSKKPPLIERFEALFGVTIGEFGYLFGSKIDQGSANPLFSPGQNLSFFLRKKKGEKSHNSPTQIMGLFFGRLHLCTKPH